MWFLCGVMGSAAVVASRLSRIAGLGERVGFGGTSDNDRALFALGVSSSSSSWWCSSCFVKLLGLGSPGVFGAIMVVIVGVGDRELLTTFSYI